MLALITTPKTTALLRLPRPAHQQGAFCEHEDGQRESSLFAAAQAFHLQGKGKGQCGIWNMTDFC